MQRSHLSKDNHIEPILNFYLFPSGQRIHFFSDFHKFRLFLPA